MGMACWAMGMPGEMDLVIKALPAFGIAGHKQAFEGRGPEVIEITQKTLEMSVSPV
jgi:hypothetical protein